MVTIVFWGLCKLVDVLPQTRAGDDAAMAQWFALDKLGELEMAFDHREVVALGIERLKTTSEYKNLAKQ